MIVKYSKKFPYAPFLNEDIGFEMSIPDDGDPLAELKTLKDLAEKFHKENNPQLEYQTSVSPIPQGIQPIPAIDRKAIDELERAIDNATTLEDLAKHKDQAGANGLMQQYMGKLKSLQL